jgi:hypothetical protein
MNHQAQATSSNRQTNPVLHRLISSWPGILLLILFSVLVMYNSFLCDDAFITFRFARNLSTGAGPVFNPGERVEGYTNFLWMLMMAIVIKAGGAPGLWSRLLSIAFSLGTIVTFLTYISRRSDEGLIRWLFVAFLAFSSPFLVWSTGGMETAAFAFFVFIGLVSFLVGLEQGKSRSLVCSSLLFSAAALTRPEGILVFSLALGCLALFSSLKKTSFKQCILLLLPFLALYGAYFIWRLSYYGKFFPNTYYVKAPGALMASLGLAYYWHFLIDSALWLPVTLAAYWSIKSRRISFGSGDVYITLLLAVYSAYVIYAGGDFMALARFLMPLLPIVYLLLHRLYSPGEFVDRRKGGSVLATVALVAFVIVNIHSCIKAQGMDYDEGVDSIGVLQDYVTKWSDVGRLIYQDSRPTDTIAVTAAGAIPYFSQLYTIDMRGLEASDLGRYTIIRDSIRPGHVMMISMSYLFEMNPQFIIGHPRITRGQLNQHPFGQPQNINDILLKKYTAASTELPDLQGYFLNFWVRNDIIPRMSEKMRFYRFDNMSQ